MSKTLFTIHPHSFVDVITNSSSELFVSDKISKDLLTEMITEIYPDFLNEYEPLKSSEELSNNEISHYLSYAYEYWSNRDQCTLFIPLKGFTDEEVYATYSYGKHIKYDFVNDNTRQRVLDAIDPDRTKFFLFSINENPDWEYQEKLMGIMKRYYLG